MASHSLGTKLNSYQIIHTNAGASAVASPLAAPTTAFAVTTAGGPSGAYDMGTLDGEGEDTGGNAMNMIVYGDGAAEDTCTIQIWAASEQGPQEYIASLSYVFGAALHTLGGTIMWADTCGITSYHTSPVNKGGATNDDIIRVEFDLRGFRYVRPYVTAVSGIEDVNILARFF